MLERRHAPPEASWPGNPWSAPAQIFMDSVFGGAGLNIALADSIIAFPAANTGNQPEIATFAPHLWLSRVIFCFPWTSFCLGTLPPPGVP